MRGVVLSGRMGSGTSTAADFLQARGAQRWSRTEVMLLLASAFGPSRLGDPDVLLARLFEDESERDEVRLQLLRFSLRYQPEAGKPRRLYQQVTDICQDQDPLCFETELAQRIDSALPASLVLIDDVRTVEALDFWRGREFFSVRVEAPEDLRRRRILAKEGSLPSDTVLTHASEVALDDVEHDLTIVNDGSVEDLHRQFQEHVVDPAMAGTII